MSWKKKGEPAKEQQERKVPTFEIRQTKAGGYFARIGGGVLKKGRSYASIGIFPSKFEGQFVGVAIGGFRGNFIPATEENIDIKGNTLVIDYGWLKIEATGENVEELKDWLAEYPQTVEKVAFPQREEAEQPQKKGWKK